MFLGERQMSNCYTNTTVFGIKNIFHHAASLYMIYIIKYYKLKSYADIIANTEILTYYFI